VRADNPEAAAEWRLEAALWETAFGNAARALREGAAALKLAPLTRTSLPSGKASILIFPS